MARNLYESRVPKQSIHRDQSSMPITQYYWAVSYTLRPHWSQTNMTEFFNIVFSNAFSCMEIISFVFKFHWSLFPRTQFTMSKLWFRRQAITWTNVDKNDCRNIVSLSHTELKTQVFTACYKISTPNYVYYIKCPVQKMASYIWNIS